MKGYPLRVSPDKAVRLVARYNRGRIQLEKMRERVERKQAIVNRVLSQAFDALPEDFGITLPRDIDDPCYVADPNGQRIAEPGIAYSDQDEALLREFRG